MGTRARVSILKRFEAGATAPANAEAASLPPTSKTVDYRWPTLGDVITAQQTQCAACERAAHDLERRYDPALILPIYEKP